MNAVARLTAADQLALYRTHHRIEGNRAPDWNRCDVCHVRVYQVLARRWQHDPDELLRLQREAAIEEESARVAADVECGECITARSTDMYPPHNASPRCESGRRSHCSCDVCF